jgi:hypothetical protein
VQFLDAIAAELRRLGLPALTIRKGNWGYLPLGREGAHLAVKPFTGGRSKVELCCEGRDPEVAFRELFPRPMQVEAAMGSPAKEERRPGVHRIRWAFYRQFDPTWPGEAVDWAVRFMEAGFKHLGR